VLTIRRYGNVAEAGFAQSLLVAAGIDASLPDDNAGTLGPQFVPWGMRLQVPEEDAERAIEILDGQGGSESVSETIEPDPAVPMEHEVPQVRRPEVTCPGCGTEWSLNGQELAQPSFTCTECGTAIPLEGEIAGRPGVRSILSCFLPRSESKWVFILGMAAYARLLQAMLKQAMDALLGSDDYADRIFGWSKVLSHLADALVFAPIWETLLLVGIIELLRMLRFPAALQVLLSTAVLCAVDGFNFWPHGIAVMPFFMICGLSYLYWRPTSWRIGIFIVILVHTVCNCVPATWLICEQVDRVRVAQNEPGYAANWIRANELWATAEDYLRDKSNQKAVDTLQQAINLYPYDPHYYVTLGIAFDNENRRSNEEAAFRKAISLDANNSKAWDWLGDVLNQEGRYAESLDAFQRALAAAPPYERARIQRWSDYVNPRTNGTSR
jgi:tetratricopeptide (TPR) repeat protein